MSGERVIGEFSDESRAREAAAVLAEHGFAVEGLTALDPPDLAPNEPEAPAPLGRPGNVVLAVAPTDRHEEARALLCAAGALETDFSLTGDERKPPPDSP